MTNRWLCRECGYVGEETLTAQNPFSEDPLDKITGCPQCKAVECLFGACEYPDCKHESSSGKSTPSGYRRICAQHKSDEALETIRKTVEMNRRLREKGITSNVTEERND